MGDGRCWRSLISLLQSRYRCISLDLLGFGNSSKPDVRYDIATLVDFVHQVIEALNLSSVILVGHSLGGWVAAAYALTYDQVDALVLLAPAGIRDDSFCGRYDHLRPLLWRTPVVDWVFWLGTPIAQLLRQQTLWTQLRWFRQELNTQPAPRSFLLDRLRPEDAIDTVEQEIHRLHVPTLVVVGEYDDTIPLWHCQTYTNQIVGAQLHVLPNADHALPQHASAIAPLIVEFLAHAHAVESADELR